VTPDPAALVGCRENLLEAMEMRRPVIVTFGSDEEAVVNVASELLHLSQRLSHADGHVQRLEIAAQ